jgi:Na+-driven multidrug efflux pump
MAGRTGWDLLVYLAGFTIDIGVALVLAGPSSLGVRGAAIAQAITLSFSAVARLMLVRRFLGIWPFDRTWMRLAVPALLGALTMGSVHAVMPDGKWALDLLVSAGLGTGVYGGAMLAIGLSPTERTALAGLIRRRPTGAAP